MGQATRASWKITPLPRLRQPLSYDAYFTDAEAERLQRGFIPREMEDKWFIFCEDGWLYFHRSWTGFCIFALRLMKMPTGVGIAETWVSRDPEEYKSSDAQADKQLIDSLIRSHLLEAR